MRLKLLFSFFLIILTSLSSNAQERCFFEHYGPEDGLPQHTIMSILQDNKGFIWFSTWNGLCRFDGYNFYTYKIQLGDKYHMRSNRIDFITEDKYGYIWTLPYDMEPHRFDPRTEDFMGIRSLKEYEDFTFIASKIVTTKSGKTWLLSNNMGCVCVTDSSFSIEIYNTDNKRINGNTVYSIYEDSELNTWILTNNGLYSVSKDNKKVNSYFTEKAQTGSNPTQDFYSVMEQQDNIWFGSGNGRIWIHNKKSGQSELFQTNAKSEIRHIEAITGNEIVITTRNDGFFIYNTETKELKKYDKSNVKELRSDKILSTYIDRARNIWFEVDYQGVAKFNPQTREMKHFEMNTESSVSNVFPSNYFIFEDRENRVWIHPRGGGFGYYDPQKDQLMPFFNEPSSPNWKFSNMMHAAFSDQQGNLWLSTRSHGLDKVIFNNDVFKTITVDPNIHSTINNDVRSIFEDSRQNLWVSAKGGKVFVYDKNRVQKGYLCRNGKIEYGAPIEGITYCMTEDSKKNIWIGTKGEGVYKLIPAGDSYNIDHYSHLEEDLFSLSHNSVYAIFEDNKQRIWIGTYGGGLNLLDEKEKKFINYRNNLKNYPSQFGSQIRTLLADKFGNICIGTTLGLIMFSTDFDSPSDIDYKFYTRIPEDNESLSENDVYDICTTAGGETYFATFGGGLNKVTAVDMKGFPTKFRSYKTKDGLPSDVILTLTEDKEGKLWITSEGNLTKFDPEKNSFETYSEINRLIAGQNFSEGSRWTSQTGTIYLGYSKGVLSIDPANINKNTFKPYVALTRFQIANKDVPIGGGSPLKENIDDIEKIRLNYKQNFINIEFVALDYVEPKRISYAYKLDGVDGDWIITKEQRIANYNNLSPGKYIFRVKSTNSDGVWMDNEHVLHLEITPSFWQTGWSYLLYFLLIVAVLYAILRTLFVFYRLKDKVKLEQEQTEMKTRFFTDISHEIRTPLTMIVSPVENIIEDNTTPEEIKSQLQLVLKNTNRMQRMVNQILDFRKIQKQKLNIQETAIGEYVDDICKNFTKTAEYQNIKLQFNDNTNGEKIWIDRDNVEKLVFNLLSNAFKYTPDDKAIEINIFKAQKDNSIAIQVKDEGRGMSKEVLNKLFTRFASFNKDKSKPSTGIGLSIVKEVAEKHHAKIAVDSEVNKGSSFTILFPTGIEHFKDDENVNFVYTDTIKESEEEAGNLHKTSQETEGKQISVEEITEEKDKKETILVVEDDNDLRGFITTILEPYYNVLEAENGRTGYEFALKYMPDFILSDIMMPEMNGVEFLQEIRKNDKTSHIPFILLTAKTDLESKVDGLDYGADDYITKPFSVKYLRARIDNIIRQRKRLYESFSTEKQNAIVPIETIETDTETTELKITPQDEAFIRKIKEEVEKNIDNSDFVVDNLAAAVAMSRTVFFKKLKSLTGFAPIEFIRDIKIKHAAKLIATQQYTIKEVSFMIGIADTKYFTQCFKAVYNMTPSEYKNLQNRSK
ncbi:signal transduction histidine kinase/DNA-binding response OmpR family regulator/ligand-binding sensor domain-containing protein [Dysgonomonas hofstadii]|uniref:histidine kinase n=1 Tax=Dysgonomonas hofstadii TaxID=637886 RepID=A0A840CGA9_9BACT|nr:two-component regulator propeller domain-containing protein [Dysgonomonas hofstadii]MBB4035000.1 signal transduction histidine kinase/DNA-binding response OmpR family regulator/ligand-binding sensor domain-containing protein [Dysgonomonas hofstadii]